jgi:hypothetical protein
MRTIITTLIIVICFASCNKEECRFVPEAPGASYYNANIENTIQVQTNYSNEIQIQLPKIPSYSGFGMVYNLIIDKCHFEIEGFHHNYAPSNSGPHYWLTGSGSGQLNKDELFIEYDYTVKETSQQNPYPEGVVTVDTSFSASYIKQ